MPTTPAEATPGRREAALRPRASTSVAAGRRTSSAKRTPEVPPLDAGRVSRVGFCSGKIYYDLVAAREKGQAGHVAIVRSQSLGFLYRLVSNDDRYTRHAVAS